MSKIKFIKSQQPAFLKTSLISLLISLILLSSFLLIKPFFNAQAQTTDDAEASEESTILNIKKVIQDKQAELGQNSQENNQRKQAYLAQVKRVSAETLTVLNDQLNIIIPVTDDLAIIKDEKTIDIDQIEVEDWVIVYSVVEKDTANVKRILVSDKDFTQVERKIMLGTIVEIYSSNLLFDARTGEENLSFLIDKNTQFFDLNGDEISINDFYPDLQCLIVAKSKTNGQWQLTSIKALVDLND